ncbi:ribosome biogenesis GTPase Der [Legionella sp. W05-934-2]|jgi:GTP-binding protein|uniref:ribosome biogenesis GTPase Der n=1 Tax=Legionella sp. W05-934-2 TaxID=1198649 RepID=UPI00346353FF
MEPVVVLVGRPNVGKSTLFNGLTRSRDALVADFPGLTRDRQYGHVTLGERPFIIVDTGGIGVDDAAVDTLMSRQSTQALQEADVILFVVDGRSGLSPIDSDIANQLRRMNKPVILGVNKTDGMQEDVALGEFAHLGFNHVVPLAASHGRGLQDLVYQCESLFPPEPTESEDTTLKLDKEAIVIAFIGRPNVGKSTLVNRILGEERVVVYDMPGTTRDSIRIPFSRNQQSYILIDTAGVRKRGRIQQSIEKFSVIKSLQAIDEANVCLLVIDAREGVTEQDLHMAGFIVESGRAIVIVVNKWDGLDEESKDKVKQDIERRLPFLTYAKKRFVSALHGSNVGLLYADIHEAYDSANMALSTSKLTRLLQDMVSQHQPPLVKGRRIKLRYAHAGGHNPPTIVIHGNQLNDLPDSYKRYLANQFTEQLNLVGTPVKISFKTGDNPFKNKKNELTPRQQRKKKRLISRRYKK